VRIGRRASRLATTKARRRIPTKTTGVGPDPGTSVVANVAVFGRMATRTLREAVAEARACVVSPAKAILIGYVPRGVGAFVTTEARPELLVFALRVTPLSVKVTVCPAIATPADVLSVALRVSEAPGAAAVEPV
jgi:hypothetical protein